MKRAFVLLALVLASPAMAETWLTATVTSWHTDREAGYNERNLGAGLQHAVSPDLRLIAGHYRNSLDRPSNYVGVHWFAVRWGSWAFGAQGGTVTGYNAGSRWSPLLLPVLTYERRWWGVDIPAVAYGGEGVITVVLKFRLQ